MIIKTEEVVPLELGDQPALPLYKSYLGPSAEAWTNIRYSFPFAVREEPNSNDFVIRSVTAYDEDKQSLQLTTSVPEGSYAQIMSGNVERLIQGAAEAAEKTVASADSDSPQLALAVSCVARRDVLGDRTSEEFSAVLEVLGSDTGLVGFYSAGEISSPIDGRAELHNQTMTLMTISEI